MTHTDGNQKFMTGALGLAFKNGKLYEFTDRHVLVMQSWPKPFAWYKRRSHDWRPTRKLADRHASSAGFFSMPAREPEKPSQMFVLPDGQLVFPGFTSDEWVAKRHYQAERSRVDFIRLIPDEIRHELMRYRCRRWHLLSVFARCPGALDLSRSNPALLYALASNWVFHKPALAQPMRASRGLVNRKQRLIQAWLDFPDSETVRRILAKIEPGVLSIRRLLYLRPTLADPLSIRLLSHLPRIGELALLLVSMPQLRLRVTPRLLQETVRQESDPGRLCREAQQELDAFAMIMDTLRMGNAVRWERCPARFHSFAGIKRLHDSLVERMHTACEGGLNLMADTLPAPPFAGTDEIVPLTTVSELVREGDEQHNCAAVRAQLVAQGKQYLYSVRQPVRGTLAIYFNGIEWRPLELRQAFNASVPQTVWQKTFKELFESDRF